MKKDQIYNDKFKPEIKEKEEKSLLEKNISDKDY